MRIFTDQNVEAPIIVALRASGHDVLEAASTLLPEADDEQVLARAEEDRRILLTNDKDFGELTFLQRRAREGLILLRLPGLDSRAKAERAVSVLSVLGDRVQGSFVVVTETKVRRRPLRVLE